MTDHLRLFREFADLDRRRCSAGVSPLEYQRWLDLRGRLGSEFGGRLPEGSVAGEVHAGPDRREHERRETRMLVDFETPEHFRRAYISDLSRGGVFVNTPFAPEIGTELVLCVRFGISGDTHEFAGTVVTNNVAGGFTTDRLGMGVHFKGLSPEQRLVVDGLCALAAPAEGEA